MLISRILESAGFRHVSGTSDPATAFERCERELPDLLILDLSMPPIDGVELLERLRPRERRPTPLAVLVVSGANRESEQAQRARAAGAGEVLEKPFTRARLVEAVHVVLGHPPGGA